MVVISVDQIDYWRGLPRENEIIEFKEAKSQFDSNKLCQYCVAIANEGGGHLVFGIRDKIPRPVVGTSAFDNLNGIAEKLFNALRFRVEVAETAHPDGRVVTFRIPGRPPATPLEYDGRYLMRNGESLVSMSPDVMKRICRELEPDWLEEPTVIKVGAARVTELLDTQTYFHLIGSPYPSAFEPIMDRLKTDRLIDDEGGGAYSIRRIAALTLARDLSAFPELQRKAPRIISYQGTSKLSSTSSDKTANKGYAVGFQGLVHNIMRRLPGNEVIQNALRVQVKLIPEIAIRELVANALIHQDLSIGGASVVIEIFTNRFEVSNPGEPIVPVDRLIDGFRSRNERLAYLMRRMRICEERGKGVDEVVRAAELFQLPAPDFRAMEKRTLVTVFGHTSFEDMGRDDRIRACFQHCALKRVMSERMTCT